MHLAAVIAWTRGRHDTGTLLTSPMAWSAFDPLPRPYRTAECLQLFSILSPLPRLGARTRFRLRLRAAIEEIGDRHHAFPDSPWPSPCGEGSTSGRTQISQSHIGRHRSFGPAPHSGQG